jgi:hypothetical protein
MGWAIFWAIYVISIFCINVILRQITYNIYAGFLVILCACRLINIRLINYFINKINAMSAILRSFKLLWTIKANHKKNILIIINTGYFVNSLSFKLHDW